MTTLTYHIVNVFTRGDDRFSGNPLCVVEHAESLDTATLQALDATGESANLARGTRIASDARHHARDR